MTSKLYTSQVAKTYQPVYLSRLPDQTVPNTNEADDYHDLIIAVIDEATNDSKTDSQTTTHQNKVQLPQETEERNSQIIASEPNSNQTEAYTSFEYEQA